MTTNKRSYANIYIKFSNELRQQAEEKLERPLTNQELGCIYNAGSIMMLESVEIAIANRTKENLSEELLSQQFQTRLKDTQNRLPDIIEEQFLGQSLPIELAEKLREVPYVYTAQQIIAGIEKLPQENRLERLQRIIDELISST